MYHVVPSWHLWMPETEIANNWKRTKQKCLKFSDCFLLWTVAHNLVLRLKPTSSSTQLPCSLFSYIYRVSHELRSLLRESVPYVKIYRYNRKHLCPKLNGYGGEGQRKVWSFRGSTYCTWFAWCNNHTLRIVRPCLQLAQARSSLRLHM